MYSKKAVLITVAVLLCSTASGYAQDESVIWGSWYSPGNVIFSARGAYERPSGYSGGLGIYPGAELILHKYGFEDVAPIDIGVAARGHFGIGTDNALDNSMSAGVGGLATFHLGFRGLDPSESGILGKLEYFAELGLGFDSIKYNENDSALRFVSMTGINYFLTPSTAISIGYNRWGDISGGFLGLQLKIGPTPKVDSTQFEADIRTSGRIMMTQMYVSQFYAIYWYAFAAGGFYFDDSSYEVGQGTLWSLTSYNEDEEIRLEKALLSIEDDGSKWWRVAFSREGDRLVYEYHIAPDYQLLKMRFKDVAENKVGEYEFSKETDEAAYESADVEPINPEDYAEYKTGTERIKVAGDTYECDVLKHTYSSDSDEWNYTWWASQDVPGSLVKFYWELNNEEEWMQGELIEITRGNRPELK
ncbi:MAG: hypothetical protein K9L66_05915 [Spirochaetaceae bacterium]|nr:hypothetical protein [Spirochaetaceae bacterium]MCF7938818.1 hypothetical protein [Spirochaetales bacterium]